MGIKITDEVGALAYIDITTGEFKASEISGEDIVFRLLGEINKIAPKEILLDEKTYDKYIGEFQKHNSLSEIKFTKTVERKKLKII